MSKMDKATIFKAHPIYIYKMLKRFVFVLILPVLKGAIQYILYRRISGVILLESIALAAIIALSVWRLLSFKVVLVSDNLIIEDGVILRKRAVIPIENISSIAITSHFVIGVFGAVNVSVNTESGIYGRKDFSFKMYKKDAAVFETMIYGSPSQVEIKFTPGKIALLSATASASLTGLIVGVPVINRIGRLLNVGVDRILSDITELSKSIKSYFPPIVNAITIVFIAVYGLSFLIALSRNMFFRTSTNSEKIEIKSGLYFKHKRIFKISAVKDVCIDQTPLMRAFKIFTMRVGIGGYGGENGEKSTIVPAMKKRKIKEIFSPLFPILAEKPDYVYCKKDNLTRRRFLMLPNIYVLIILGVTALLIIFLPSFERLFLFAAIVSLCFVSYYGYISLINQKICGISIGKTVVAKGVSRFTVREMYTPADNIGLIKIMRTPVDIAKNTCRVTVQVRSESSDSVKVRFLPYDKIKEKINETYGINL